MKMMAYERFGRDVGTINAHDSAEDAEELIRKSLNISFEWSVLEEAQHIIDELQIMQEVFKQQVDVMKDFEEALKSMTTSSATLERAAALIRDMEMRRDELAGLEGLQTKTRMQVSATKRNATPAAAEDDGGAAARLARHEAAAGRNYRGKGSHQTSRRGRSPGAVDCRLHRLHRFLCEHAAPSSSGSQPLKVPQLPLSFLASIFGMNAQELNNGNMPLGAQFKYMCKHRRTTRA